MATIEKRRTKDGKLHYRVKIRKRGHTPITATFPRLTDARRFERATEATITEGRYFPQSESRRHTLAEAIERYCNTVLPSKREHTAKQQRQQLGWWSDRIGPLRMSDVTPSVIARERDALATQVGPASVNRYLSAIGHVFTIAVTEWEWMDEHPMPKVRRLTEPRGRVRFLDDDERTRLLDACQKSSHQYLYLIVVLALSTGARRSEITRLKWSQVGPGCKRIILTETKNGERRVLPLAGRARELMHQHVRQQVVGIEWVFPGRSRRGPANIEKAWQKALKDTGIEDFRFHDLRHSAASYLAMNGASLAEIAEILGHKTLSMVKRYAHLSEAHTADVVRRMNERYLS